MAQPRAGNVVLRMDRQPAEGSYWFASDESRPLFNGFSRLSIVHVDGKEAPDMPRLRAEILVGDFDLRAEMRSGLPRPARIVQDRAGERDDIGITGTYNGFRLLEFGDQTHGDDGHAGGSLDRASERNLVVGPNRNLLRRCETAAPEGIRVTARYRCGVEVNP
jgi:hypothetical protein